ncbi:arginyl-tRNA synthetase [Entomortierella parvispora]|uniref:arginine--tRNA ligase n=1 Tax=Entomortierella parvispora TaxID=205924 RepID=A0A9P3HB13_9FUNG|nr:arginyl-tRNA synthetase [Entomortierella parvispora]
MNCQTHVAFQEEPALSTLATFRAEIASHLSRVLQRPVEDLLPLIQNETKARAGGGAKGHSLFSVPVQRLFISAPRTSSSRKQKEGASESIDDRNKGNDNPGLDRESLLEQLLVLPEDTKLLAKVSLGANKSLLMFEPDRMELIRRTCLAITRDLSDLPDGQSQKQPEDAQKTVLGKRGRAKDSLVIVNALSLSQTEGVYSNLRRAAIAGFVSRLMNLRAKRTASLIVGQELEEARIGIASGHTIHILDGEASLDQYNDLLGLGSHQESNSGREAEGHIAGSEWAFEKMRMALQSNPALVVRGEEGSSFVDLTAHGLGQAKVFSTDPSSMAFESSTLITRTMVQLAYHLKEHKESCTRYIWILPEGRKHFADQVLRLIEIIFNSPSEELLPNGDAATDKIEPCIKDKKTRHQGAGTGLWTNLVELVLYDPSFGPDLWNGATPFENKSIGGLIDYATVRMKEVVVENRGDPQGMDDEDMYGDDEGEKPALDEASLSRMATILSTSALVVASVGTRLRKKIQLDLTKILDGKGNSGVFLQYVQSRLCGIERNSQVQFNPEADLSLLQKIPEAYALAKVLSEWEDLVSSSSSTVSTTLDPSPLVLYLFNLAAEVGQANRTMRVKGMKQEVAEARWLLFWCAKKVLEEGLWLLGLESVGMM